MGTPQHASSVSIGIGPIPSLPLRAISKGLAWVAWSPREVLDVADLDPAGEQLLAHLVVVFGDEARLLDVEGLGAVDVGDGDLDQQLRECPDRAPSKN